MITYPTFVATLAERGIDLDALAVEADVHIATIHAVMNGGIAPSLTVRARLARALGVAANELFALDPELEQALAPLGARRFVTDPATLRLVDRPKAGAA